MSQVSATVVRETEPLEEDLSKSTEGEHRNIEQLIPVYFTFPFVTLCFPAMPFNASLNSIVVSREYFLDFRCTYELMHYPFDTQVFQYHL